MYYVIFITLRNLKKKNLTEIIPRDIAGKLSFIMVRKKHQGCYLPRNPYAVLLQPLSYVPELPGKYKERIIGVGHPWNGFPLIRENGVF